MDNITIDKFLKYIVSFFPARRGGKRGPKPIPKVVLLYEYFWIIRQGKTWREVKHSATVRRYTQECMRRGIFMKLLKKLAKFASKHRPKEMIINSTDLVSYNSNRKFKYNGKYHNYCSKLTLAVNEKLQVLGFRLDKGSEPDSLVLNKWIEDTTQLPRELFLDKGYEKYSRRRILKSKNCQVRLESPSL